MRDEDFEGFIEDFGEATHHQPVPPEAIERYRGVLPDQLLTYWQEEGWCGYADGLFWTVNPEDYEGIVAMWLEGTVFEEIDRYNVIARTAFGKLYLLGERYQQKLTLACPIHSIIGMEKELRKKEANPELSIRCFFSMRSPEDCDLKDEQDKTLFRQALKRLGPLAPDEVYGFEPALALGGKKRVENLAKLKIQPHLTILRQLAAPDAPFRHLGMHNLQP